jgi:cellulose synthase/poly-beta-1,6-N-acetylglucosamine synthase-like glycosyltransferase
MWGKVTCLPGCVAMFKVREEMGPAIKLYAKPVTDRALLRHQVQYLGTDRRMTYCTLAQGLNLRTVFVADAISETVAPQTLGHYISQRRRWASNAYFNNYFYLFGPNQLYITRVWAAVDLVRLSMVYYRVANSVLFIYGLVRSFTIVEIIPLLIVTQTPAVWYLVLVMIREPLLRKRAPKLLLGMCINELISPILSVIIFTRVSLHLGNQGIRSTSTIRVFADESSLGKNWAEHPIAAPFDRYHTHALTSTSGQTVDTKAYCCSGAWSYQVTT